MRKGERLARGAVAPNQHFTQPPPRYTEASLVKKLEELGIGRPSTYASIMQVLQDRDYVRLEKRRFVPEDRGRLVTAFLTSFFERYVEYNFTADLENQLDDVSGGRIDWKEVLRKFWRDFSAAVDGTKELTISQVLDAPRRRARPAFLSRMTAAGARPAPLPGLRRRPAVSLKLGKFGAFIGCSNYPECRYTRAARGRGRRARPTPRRHRARHRPREPAARSALKKGPYGHYVQLGEGERRAKPKRVALPRALKPADVDLDTALRLLALPRELGRHPETGEPIIAGIGRFGAYIKHGTTFKSLGADDDVLTIGLNRAVVLLAEAGVGAAPRPATAARARDPSRRRHGRPLSGPLRPLCQPRRRHRIAAAQAPIPTAFSLDEALPLLAAQRDKGKAAPAAQDRQIRRERKPLREEGAAKRRKTAPSRRRAKDRQRRRTGAGALGEKAPRPIAGAARLTSVDDRRRR